MKWTLMFFDLYKRTWDRGGHTKVFDTKKEAQEHKELLSSRGGYCYGLIKVVEIPSCECYV